MKTCPNCGRQTADESKFCEGCGYSFDQVRAPEQGAPAFDGSQAAQQGGFPGGQPTGPMQGQPTGPMPGQMIPAGMQGNPYQQYYGFNPKDHTAEFDERDIADNKLFAACAYLFGILGVISALLISNSPFSRFHAKQAIKLNIATIIVLIPAIIPFLGWIVSGICLLVLAVIGIIAIVNVLSGKAIEAPIVSDIGFLKG